MIDPSKATLLYIEKTSQYLWYSDRKYVFGRRNVPAALYFPSSPPPPSPPVPFRFIVSKSISEVNTF